MNVRFVSLRAVPRLKDETRAARRAQVEEAALRCFTERGYRATTMRDIADLVGMTPGALYAHYPGKEQLYLAVIEGYRERLKTDPGTVNAVRDLLDHGCDFPHDIPALASAVRDLVVRHAAYWKLWYVDVIEFGGAHFQRELRPANLLAHPAIQARLRELRRSGAVRGRPELAFVITYMQLFNYFLLETLFSGRGHYGVSEDEAVSAIADVVLHGVLSDDARAGNEPRKRRGKA